MSPAESSGASPDREATGVDLMKAWYGDDTTWGIIKEFERDRWRRLADRVSLLGAAPREDARAEAAHVAAQIVTPAIRLKLGAQTEYLESAIRAALVERDNLLREVNDDREDLMGGGLTVDPLTARVNAMLGAPEPAKEPVMTDDEWRRAIHGLKPCGCPRGECIHDVARGPAPPVMDEPAREAPEPATHELKCWPTPFDATWRGMKRHEFRVDDRDFKPGDTVRLREWSGEYTSRLMEFDIGTVSRGPFYGIPDGYCVFTLLDHARAAARGDADAALLRECREYVATHGGIAAREHAQGLLARIDASLSRIGEPS